MVRRKQSPSKSEDNHKSPVKNDSNKKDASRQYKRKDMKVFIQEFPETMTMSHKIYREIRKYQAMTNLLIPRLPFARLIYEILVDMSPSNERLRIQSNALRALQEACEMYMVQYFEDSYFCAMHAKRKTLQVKDMQCVRRLRGRSNN